MNHYTDWGVEGYIVLINAEISNTVPTTELWSIKREEKVIMNGEEVNILKEMVVAYSEATAWRSWRNHEEP